MPANLGQTLGTAQFLRWTLDASARVAWLEDFADQHQDEANAVAPERLADGIRFEDVSFRYPGTEGFVLAEVNLRLPAGSVIAVVGENGAGKTTLVKLLCSFYEPTSGRITVDGTPLNRIPAIGWRERIAGAFQDFVRFEFRAQRSVGLGDQPRETEVPAVQAAVARGGAVGSQRSAETEALPLDFVAIGPSPPPAPTHPTSSKLATSALQGPTAEFVGAAVSRPERAGPLA